MRRSDVSSESRDFPSPVVRRLPRYLNYLERLDVSCKDRVSSRELAEAIGVTRSTVRMDISYLPFSSAANDGYVIEEFRAELEAVLGVGQQSRVMIVGAGNLGRALSLHEEFRRRGFEICAIFDSDVKLHGKMVGKLEVLGMGAVGRVVRDEGVTMAILAVPAKVAQEVVDELVQAGVSGVLNLACAELLVPDNVAVVESRTVIDLMELRYAVLLNG